MTNFAIDLRNVRAVGGKKSLAKTHFAIDLWKIGKSKSKYKSIAKLAAKHGFATNFVTNCPMQMLTFCMNFQSKNWSQIYNLRPIFHRYNKYSVE